MYYKSYQVSEVLCQHYNKCERRAYQNQVAKSQRYSIPIGALNAGPFTHVCACVRTCSTWRLAGTDSKVDTVNTNKEEV